MSAQPAWTGLQIDTSFFPLSFFLFLVTPTIIIDGVAWQRPWGTHYFQLPAGTHTVTIFFQYIWMQQCGANSINVMVHEGYVSRIKYEMPPWMFAKGSMRELQPYVPQK